MIPQNTETQQISLSITPDGADAGSFTGDTSGTGPEDGGSITGTLIFSDPDGATSPGYTIAVGDGPAYGSASIDENGLWSYTPNDDFYGSDSFTVSVTDDSQNTETQQISLSITPDGADAGSFTGDTSGTGPEDGGSITGTLIFSDPDGATSPGYTIAVGDGPAYGSASIDENGLWSYTPNDDFYGSDSFTVSVTDDSQNTETQQISLSITPDGADAGSFTGDTSGTGPEDGGSITGTLIFSDPDGATSPGYTIAVGDGPAYGSASIDENGLWSYTPNDDFYGSDSFTVSVTDDSQNTETQQISLSITPDGADAGSFTGDTSGTGPEDGGSITGTLIFSDPDGATSPGYTIAVGDGPAYGSASIDENGLWSYTPNDDFYGSDSFTVSVTDDSQNTETQQISLSITPDGADAGSFTGDTSGTGPEDGGSITGTLIFSDPDGATSPGYTIAVGDGPAYGSASIDENGLWSYTPNDDFYGSDSFTVSVTDDSQNTETQQISLSITPDGADAGSFTGDTSGTGPEDGGSITGTLIFSDPDGATSPGYTIAVGDGPAYGSASIDENGLWSYTPNDDFYGSDSFTVSVTDDSQNTETQQISLSITPDGADAGSFTGDTSGTGPEDGGSITGTLIFSDPDGATSPGYTIAVGDGPAYGSASIDENGLWSYTPNDDFYGSDSFTVSVTDDSQNTETQQISLSITPDGADAGSFTGDISGTGPEDGGSITGTLIFSDPDGATSPGYTIAVGDGPAYGSASIDENGLWSYTPNDDFYGSDSFTVSVTDDSQNTETQQISLSITPDGADAGSFTGDTSGTGPEDGGSITGTLIFSDPDGATSPGYTIAVGDGPAYGSASIDENGLWSYTPNDDFYGSDSFTVSVTDDSQNTETQQISLSITPDGADAGSFTGDTSGTGPEDGGSITGTLIFSDPDGATSPGYTIAVGDGPAYGSASIDETAYGATRLMTTSTAAIPSPSASQMIPKIPKLSRSA